MKIIKKIPLSLSELKTNQLINKFEKKLNDSYKIISNEYLINESKLVIIYTVRDKMVY